MTSNILFANHFGKVSRKFLIQVFVVFASFLIAANAQMLNKVEPVANIRFSSPNLRQEANTLRPYGNKLSIAFSAFGVDFNFEDMELYTSGTSLTDVEVHSNETIEHGKMYEATYRSLYTDKQGKKSYAIVTLNPDDNSLFAVVSQDNDTYYFQPGSSISNLLNSENTTKYSNETMAYKASDVKYTDENGESYAKCDSLTHDDDESKSKSITSTNVDLEFVKDPLHLTSILKDALKNAESDENIVEVDTESSVTPSSSSFERELNLVRWASCLPNSGVTKYTLNVNFVADVGFYNIFGSQPLVEAYVQNMVNTMNAIIDTQMGFNFHVGKLIIHKTLNSVVYNRLGKYEVGSTCSATSNYTILDYLNDMVNWVTTDVDGKKYKGQWHGLTNCFPPAGTVGIAYVAATCHSFARAGISSYMANFYEVVIHELGHNLGSSHAWTYTNLPVGSTGGCMDYNVGCRLTATDPDGPGEEGFHRSSEAPICSHLTGTLTTSNIGTTNEACWTSKPCTPSTC